MICDILGSSTTLKGSVSFPYIQDYNFLLCRINYELNDVSSFIPGNQILIPVLSLTKTPRSILIGNTKHEYGVELYIQISTAGVNYWDADINYDMSLIKNFEFELFGVK